MVVYRNYKNSHKSRNQGGNINFYTAQFNLTLNLNFKCGGRAGEVGHWNIYAKKNDS